MNLVKSVLPLLTIFGFDNGQETAVEVRPALPMWQPAGGDLVTVPGQQIDRVINRVVRVDGNVTVFEQEIIYLQTPEPEPAAPEPTPEPEAEAEGMLILSRIWRYSYESGYGVPFQYLDGSPVSGLGIDEIYRAAYEGRLIIENNIPQVPLRPHELELWNIANRSRRQRFGESARVANGRIVLQE